MTDHDAMEYLEELRRYNQQGLLLTPQNTKFDTFWDCTFQHAIRALEERINSHAE